MLVATPGALRDNVHPSHLDELACVVVDEADFMLNGPSSDIILSYLLPALRIRMSVSTQVCASLKIRCCRDVV